MTMTATILGCGSSGGVPRIGDDWGDCDPTNAKNRRNRCSLLLEKTSGNHKTTVVIDTSPDMRHQMLAAGVQNLDGVLFTHEHADHTHGIDELRVFFLRQRRRIPVWASQGTAAMLMVRFAYCVVQAPGSDYPPILELQHLTPGKAVAVDGAAGAIEATPFTVHHGNIDALGFRIGNMAYTPDVNGIPEQSQDVLSGLDVWIVDALRRTPHSSHFSLAETLDCIARFKPRRAILTNMHVDLDYATLQAELPKGVEPAFDGMTISF